MWSRMSVDLSMERAALEIAVQIQHCMEEHRAKYRIFLNI